jgi:uncharacterized membrane protein
MARTPASVFHHPIHAMLIALPIGLWTFSLFCDVVVLLEWGGSRWQDAAYLSLAGGIVGAALAAIPGFIDFLSIKSPAAKRIGIFHMVANLIALGIYLASFVLRLSGTAGAMPVVLSLIGFCLIAVSGSLGAELVYGHRIGVKEPPL